MNQHSFSNFVRSASTGTSEQLLLNRITNRIRNSLDLPAILSTTVAEVRDYLATDRVEIYQFLPDGHGWVIAEALNAENLPPLKGLHFPVDDIPPYTRELLLQQRQRTIVEIDKKSVFTSQLDPEKSCSAWVYTQLSTRRIDPCHLEYLLAMGVQSSVVVPIVLEQSGAVAQEETGQPKVGKLWGLLISHNAQPRTVSAAELDFIQLVVDQVSVAISQSVLLEKVREQARLEAELNRVTALLYTPAQVQLQQALNETVAVYQGSGGRLYLFGANAHQPPTVYQVGSQPTLLPGDVGGQLRLVEEHQIWQRYLLSTLNRSAESEQLEPWSVAWMKTTYAQDPLAHSVVGESPRVWAIADLYKEPLLRSVSPHFQETDVRGLLICPLHYGGSLIGCLTIFRDAIDQEITWAGYHAPDERQLAPRQSFDAWRQVMQGQAQKWTDVEQRLIRSLGERFSVAVKQFQLNQQVQALNSNLERQVRIRTVELEHSTVIANQQRTLANILAKLQKPLEMRDLFKTATQEMQQLLKVDRVAVFRFDPDWGGEFVDEFGTVSVGWKDTILATRKRWNDSYMQETKGSQYRDGKISVIHDVHNSELSPCHIEVLEHYCVQAYMIAPLFVDQKLWGLLGAYQHERVRTWEESEVSFLSQVATHLGVALQQSQSIEKVKLQSEALASAAEQQRILNTVIKKIRDSLELTTIFTTTTSELRRLLNADRVAIFRFLPSQDYKAGKVVAEDVEGDYPAALNQFIEEPCFFDDKYKNQKTQEQIYFINDVEQAEAQSCYREMLQKFEIKANLVAPLFDGETLWGLVCIHQCSGPRFWNEKEKELTRQIATQLGIAIQQAKFLSETEAARQAADSASQAKSRFLATMSHELRTPLNAILGMAQLLNRDASLTEQQCQRLNTIGQSGEHLLSLINGVLAMSRIEAGEAQLEDNLIHLPVFLSTLEDMLENTAISKQISLKFELANDLPEYVVADEGKLRQILINLLGNALKFTEKGSVTLKSSVSCAVDSSEEDDSAGNLTLNFSVQDTGPGIASEELGIIFEAFAQTQAGVDSHEGTGLGLTICRQFIELMGGNISVESEVGVGSSFHFSIQAGRAAQAQNEKMVAPARQVMGLAPDQPTPKILVVEDKAVNRLLLVDLLLDLGFEVREAVNGQEAIQQWQTWSPALIWMDMRMPVMDGYAATRKIKALAQEHPPVIVALTANAFEEDHQIALEAGCDDFVRKPFQEQDLVETLAKHLGVRYRYADGAVADANGGSESVAMAAKVAIASAAGADADTSVRPKTAPALLNILVAEDELSNQRVMQEMLTYLGHQACIVSNGLEAVEACKAVAYDLLMLDFQMPGLTGPKAVQQIRALYDDSSQPFIVGVTGTAIAEGSDEFATSGMDQILQKPISLEMLESLFRDWFESHGMAGQVVEERLTPAQGKEAVGSQPLSPTATPPSNEVTPAVLEKRYLFNTYHTLYGDKAAPKIVESIQAFLQDWPGHQVELEAAIATHSHEEVFQLAHHFKSFVGNQGGADLSEVCRLLETEARSEHPDYPELEARLKHETQRLELALTLELEQYQRQIEGADSEASESPSCAVETA